MPQPKYMERFKSKNRPIFTVEDRGFATPCWIWQRSKIHNGYGQISRDNRPWLAHRWFYEQAYGAVSDGLELDHLCRNRDCVNPDHLEPVTRRENLHRGNTPSMVAHRTNTCFNGHPLEGKNIILRKDTGKRSCRICHNIAQRKRRQFAG